MWEGIVQLAAKVLENRDKENVATRIPLHGRFDNPEPDLWATQAPTDDRSLARSVTFPHSATQYVLGE